MAGDVQYVKHTTRTISSLTPKDTDRISKEYISVTPQRELNFVPQNNKYTAELYITNLSSKPILYKIRTTAARHYLVHPTAGKILEKDCKIVTIILPLKDEVHERAEDLFLVQAIPCDTEDVEDNVKIVLKNFQNCNTPKDQFQNIKLKVHYELETNPSPVEYKPFLLHSHTPNKAEREILGERFGVQTVSTAPGSIKSQDIDHELNQQLKRQVRFEEGNSRHSLDEEIERHSSQQSNNTKNIADDVRSSVYKDFHCHELTNAFIASPDQSLLNTSHPCEKHSDKESLGAVSSSSKEGLVLRKRCKELEKKYFEKKETLAHITEERDAMTQELYKLRFFSKECMQPLKTLKRQKSIACGIVEKRFDLWQLFMISVIFLILGSVIAS